MASLSPEVIGDVVAACKAGASEAAQALGRALDVSLQLTVGRPGSLDRGNLPEGFDGPGLAVVLIVGQSGALFLLPETSGLVPSWCAAPDPTGQSKLTTLAQELGMILLPEAFMPDDFKAGRVKNLSGALARGAVVAGAAVVPLELSGSKTAGGTAMLVWPAASPGAVLGAAAAAEAKPPAAAPSHPAAEAPRAAKPAPPPKPAARPARTTPTSSRDLPAYSKSLLRVSIPVVVTLARKRQPLGRIVELGPGAIIHFDKSCEEMLELEAGEHPVALGEAVKVGDKFGLRITSVRLPDERFVPLKRKGGV